MSHFALASRALSLLKPVDAVCSFSSFLLTTPLQRLFRRHPCSRHLLLPHVSSRQCVAARQHKPTPSLQHGFLSFSHSLFSLVLFQAGRLAIPVGNFSTAGAGQGAVRQRRHQLALYLYRRPVLSHCCSQLVRIVSRRRRKGRGRGKRSKINSQLSVWTSAQGTRQRKKDRKQATMRQKNQLTHLVHHRRLLLPPIPHVPGIRREFFLCLEASVSCRQCGLRVCYQRQKA